jgi:hypothetical protein
MVDGGWWMVDGGWWMVDVAVRVGEEVWEKLWTGLNFNHQCECRASFRPSGWDVPFSFEVQAGLGVVEKVLQWGIGPIDRRTKPRFHKIIRSRGNSYSGVSFLLPKKSQSDISESRNYPSINKFCPVHILSSEQLYQDPSATIEFEIILSSQVLDMTPRRGSH